MFDLYILDGTPVRRHKGEYAFEQYGGRGTWNRFGNTPYAKRAAVPMTPHDFAALVEAHDLAIAAQDYNELRWREQFRRDDAIIRDACATYDLSRGEYDRAEFIARRLCHLAKEEISTQDRLRPRVAAAGARAAIALLEDWRQRPDVAAFDRLLPAHEAEDRRARVHVTLRFAPGTRRVGRSPEGALIVLLAEGTDEVRRFIRLPYLQLVKEFRERWVAVPEDSEEATKLRFRDPARDRAAVETWRSLSRIEYECLIGLLKSLGGDRERFDKALLWCGFS